MKRTLKNIVAVAMGPALSISGLTVIAGLPCTALAGEATPAERVPPTPKTPASENTAEAQPTANERTVMLRRICIDLLGRMPTQQEINDFLKDTKEGAYGRAVDRLMATMKAPASPAAERTEASRRADYVRTVQEASSALDAQKRALEEKIVAEKAMKDMAEKVRDLEVADRARAAASSAREWIVDQVTPTQRNLNRNWYKAATLTPLVKHAYLGIGVETPSETIRAQLGLAPGAGLVVNYVDESGPSKSLIHQHDVLQKIEDQILVNAEQFQTLVRMHKANETLKVTVIREAKPLTIEVKLGEKEFPVSQNTGTIDNDVIWTKAAPALDGYLAEYKPLTTPVVQSLAYTPAGEVMAVRSVQAGPIRVDDGVWTIVLPSEPGQEMSLFDTKTGKVIYRGPMITGDNDPNGQQIPKEARKAVLIWEKALSDVQTGQQKTSSTLQLTKPTTRPNVRIEHVERQAPEKAPQ